MLPLVVVVAVVAVGLACRIMIPRLRRRRMLSDLRGDWWSRFEREFHAYAGTWRAAREAERRGH